MIEATLREMREGRLTKPLEASSAMSFGEYKRALGFDGWVEWETGTAAGDSRKDKRARSE